MSNKPMKGVLALLPTVFDEEGNLDLEGFRDNIRYLEGTGMHAAAAMGSMGQYYLTNDEEFRILASITREECHRMTCIIGCHWENTKDAVARTKYAESIGADFAFIIPPYYSSWLDGESCYAHYKAIHDATSEIQIMLYNFQNANFTIDVELYDRLLSDFPRITAVKECTPTIEMGEIIRRYKDRLSVFSGSETALYLNMLLGGAGATGVNALAYPKFVLKFYDACLNKRWDEARRYDYLLNSHISRRIPERYRIDIKGIATAAGRKGGFQRAPYETPGQRDIDFHKEFLRRIGEIE